MEFMKIRSGFVSNSSSSSFLIYGTVLESDEITRLLNAKNDPTSEDNSKREELEQQLEAAKKQYKDAQAQFLAMEDKKSSEAQVLCVLINESRRSIDNLEDEIYELDDDGDSDGEYALFEKLEGLLDDTGLEVISPGYDGTYYIGASWDEVGLDETGRQFQQRVENKLKEVFGKSVTCSTHSEAWYNG